MTRAEEEQRQNPDRALVLAFQGGQRHAYDEIYRRYYDRVHATCRRILDNPADAAEATQETFLRAFRGLHTFNGRYQLGAWLGRIAANTAVDVLRTRSRSVNVVASTDEVMHIDDRLTDTEPSIEDKVAVTEALGEIQPLHARALFMRAVEGLSHREIGSRLGMSPVSVKSLLHRSRSSFKRAWEQASGWTLAPLAWLRIRTRDDGVAAASPAVGPMLEKVATSAVAAVMVVAGFSGSGVVERVAPPRDVVPLPIVDVPDSIDPQEARAAVAAAEEAAEAEEKKADGSLLDKVGERLDELHGSIQTELSEEEGSPSEDDKNAPTGVPGGKKKKPVPQPVKKVVDQAKRLVGEQGDDGLNPLQ
jgi:RNA polymerase sigma-70 factor (ECF subfamily)